MIGGAEAGVGSLGHWISSVIAFKVARSSVPYGKVKLWKRTSQDFITVLFSKSWAEAKAVTIGEVQQKNGRMPLLVQLLLVCL